ncbi:pyocin knob domain-containing protein [Paenibacillus lentus]|uniref:pyocin knob domain-containing protein n=1 Tax=Paenibacillus lentus TaxID=1338368 RepID=UPI003649D974
MANRYANLTPSKDISQDFRTIDVGFDKVQADVDAKAATVNSHIANADIHVTKADKTKWDGHVANADIHVTASQKAAWDSKADGNTETELADHVADQVVYMTQEKQDKLDGIEEGAQVNQNAFAKVNDITAADPSSQFYIVGGIGITVTTNPINGEITVTATGEAAPGAHGITHTEHGADPIPTATLTEGGLLSAAQLAEIVAHGELLDEHAVAISGLEDLLENATPNPTADTLVKRDSEGRLKAAAPSESDDVARKAELDTINTQLAETVKKSELAASPAINTRSAGTDLNNLTNNGSYYAVGGTANKPTTTNCYVTQINSPAADYAVQFATNYNGNRSFFRVKFNVVWGPWSEVIAMAPSGDITVSGNIDFETMKGLVWRNGNADTIGDLANFPDLTDKQAILRIFRNTNTSGNKLIQISRGDGTTGAALQITNGDITVLSGRNVSITSGSNPEGVVAANVGSLHLRYNGGAGTTLYVKESGTGNTGWARVNTTSP